MQSISQEQAGATPHTLWSPSLQDKQMNFWQKSQILHGVVASASEV